MSGFKEGNIDKDNVLAQLKKVDMVAFLIRRIVEKDSFAGSRG